jgi:hypothetical protein
MVADTSVAPPLLELVVPAATFDPLVAADLPLLPLQAVNNNPTTAAPAVNIVAVGRDGFPRFMDPPMSGWAPRRLRANVSTKVTPSTPTVNPCDSIVANHACRSARNARQNGRWRYTFNLTTQPGAA